jgi:ammonium transporter, Amt family
VISAGDTAWIIVATVLVTLMTPGVGFFYGGLVRTKSVVSMIGLSFLAFALVGLQWVLGGYTLAFGSDVGGLIGGLDYAGLSGVWSEAAPLASNLPHVVYVLFQLTFAAVTLAILTSAVAERIKISSFIVVALLWTTLVYDPIAHWVWAGGWLSQLGAIDFAGGTVVHISSGFSALALAYVLGKRLGYGDNIMKPSDIPMSMLGVGLLLMGWLGFNGGSALAANDLAGRAILMTMVAACAGALSWFLVNWAKGKPSALGLASGMVAGLVGITPAAGYVTVPGAIIIGAVAGVICYGAVLFRSSHGLDESCDAWAVHGVGGFWGAVATGILAAPISGYVGLAYGGWNLFGAQVVAALVSVIYAFTMTYIIAITVDKLMGLRVTEDEEYVGLDISQHGEEAYS